MIDLELTRRETEYKIGAFCADVRPNVSGNAMLYEDGELVGMYLETVPQQLIKLMNLANSEFLTERVPKTEMSRGPQGDKAAKRKRLAQGKHLVTQYSAILGSVAPKPHMRRAYPTISSLHNVRSAENYIKAMLLAGREICKLMSEKLPDQYEKQLSLLAEVPEKWRFTELFTSTISNYNISAAYHIDRANIRGSMNAIYTKRCEATGGNLYLPEYGACFSMPTDSLLIYPAWRDFHGVTPINAVDGGYRNSLIFYPLKGFERFT